MGLTILVILVIVIAILLLGVNFLISPYKPYSEKSSPFECGLPPFLGQTRTPFAISFYLVAVLFLLFDLEILLLYPVAISLNGVGPYGFWVAFTFFAILTLGFVVELSYGVLNFTSTHLLKNY